MCPIIEPDALSRTKAARGGHIYNYYIIIFIFLYIYIKLCKGEFLGMRMVKQVAQRGVGGLIPGNIQGLVRWSPDLIEDIPTHCRGLVLSNPHHAVIFFHLRLPRKPIRLIILKYNQISFTPRVVSLKLISHWCRWSHQR